MFGPDSMQVDYGSHTLVIDAEGRKVRVFSDLDVPEVRVLARLARGPGEAVRTRRQDAERGPFGAVGQCALRGGFVVDEHGFDGRDHPAWLRRVTPLA